MRIKQSVANERREQVRRLMAEHEATGESWRSIAARTGINYATLTGWAWRLRREGATNAVLADSPSSYIELVPRDAPEQSAGIELVLRGDRRLRIGAQFDAATLTRLVRALEAC